MFSCKKPIILGCIFAILTCPRRFPLRLRHSVSVQRRERAAGTRHTRGGPPSGAASTGCVGPNSAGILLSERPTETGHNTYFTHKHTNTHQTQTRSTWTIHENISKAWHRDSLNVLPYNVAAVGDVSFLPGVAIATRDNQRWHCRGSIHDKNIICCNSSYI